MAQYLMDDDFDISSSHDDFRRHKPQDFSGALSSNDDFGSPTPAYSGFSRGQQSPSDMYDFDIKHDRSATKGKSSKRQSPPKVTDPKARRSSLDERMQAILQRVKTSTSFEDNPNLESIEDTWKSIMGSDVIKQLESHQLPITSSAPAAAATTTTTTTAPENARYKSMLDSPSDSFEMSSADFEVGTIAARKQEQLNALRLSATESKEQPQNPTNVAQSAMFKSQLSSIRGSFDQHEDTLEDATDHDLFRALHNVATNRPAGAGNKPNDTGDSAGYSDEEFEVDNAEDIATQGTKPSSVAVPSSSTGGVVPVSRAISSSASMEDIKKRWIDHPEALLSAPAEVAKVAVAQTTAVAHQESDATDGMCSCT